ncbi:MAG TPA: isochorismatase family protein [Alphaproteobacteria bacterium]
MTKALLIVDVQKGFACEYASHLPKIVEDLQKYFDHVIATRFVNPNPSPWRDIMDWCECDAGSDDIDLAFDLVPTAKLITRSSYAVPLPDIRAALPDDVRDIYICGADTHACVLMSAVALFESNQFKPFIIADACASHSGEELHKAGLKSLEGLIGQQQIIEIRDL